MIEANSISLLELNNLIGRAIYREPGTQQVWVTAELSDVSTKNGHTYMELIQKDDNGQQLAKARATIWRSNFREIEKFQAVTGQTFCSGIKLKVLASANMHPLYGLSLVISAIDPTFTMGDLLIRRREILERLKREGILNANKELGFPDLISSIAIISAPQAAGYGDFMNHLSTSGLRFRYYTTLFEAAMQGDRTVATILDALAAIENSPQDWDCVVIIRGGGATSDLVAFENYELANRIATFPIPVIVGIGHERDITVLDYVAGMRVKTPTAAADFLINKWENELNRLVQYSQLVGNMVKDRINGEKIQLSYYDSHLRNFATNSLIAANTNMSRYTLILNSINAGRLQPQRQKLLAIQEKIRILTENTVKAQKEMLNSLNDKIDILSPVSVLKRGFTITKINGTITKNIKEQPESGTVVTTIFSNGILTSVVNNK